MNYEKSKYFSISSRKKIKYLFLNNKSQITVVFFHGFMSDICLLYTSPSPRDVAECR